MNFIKNKKLLILMALSINIGYSANTFINGATYNFVYGDDTKVGGSYNISFGKSNVINGNNNIVNGYGNIIDSEIFVKAIIENKDKSKEEIKTKLYEKFKEKYKGILELINQNKEATNEEIKYKIVDKYSIKAAIYNFEVIDRLIENMKKEIPEMQAMEKSFDPYGYIYDKKLDKILAENISGKDNETVKGIIYKLFAQNNYNAIYGRGNKVINGITSVVIGSNSEVENSYDQGNVAIGNQAIARGYASTAIGSFTKSLNFASIALGYGAASYGGSSVSLGSNSATFSEGSTALGSGAKVLSDRGVALGSSSIAEGASKEFGYSPYSGIARNLKSTTWKATSGVVSLGRWSDEYNSSMYTRQVRNIAAGSRDTDAVNVAQLKDLKDYVDNSNPFEYVAKNSKEKLFKYDGNFYKVENNEKYEGEIEIKAKENLRVGNIKSSLKSNNNERNSNTNSNMNDVRNNVAVVGDLLPLKKELENIKEEFSNVNKKNELSISGISLAVAMANLPNISGDNKLNLSTAYGYYSGVHSLALGLNGINDKKNLTYKISGSLNNKGNVAVGVGFGLSLEKGTLSSMDKYEKLEKEFKEYKLEVDKQLNYYRELLEKLEKKLLMKN